MDGNLRFGTRRRKAMDKKLRFGTRAKNLTHCIDAELYTPDENEWISNGIYDTTMSHGEKSYVKNPNYNVQLFKITRNDVHVFDEFKGQELFFEYSDFPLSDSASDEPLCATFKITDEGTRGMILEINKR